MVIRNLASIMPDSIMICHHSNQL